jgi:hypothetical protein
MSRQGKIARLPKKIREELNLRLDDGESGKQLVEWLNELPETKKILAEQFGGRPINEQNLTDWKQGGHQDWLRHQETRERVQRLAEHAEDLDAAAGGVEISDRLASVLAAELADAAQKLHEIADPKERWQRLQEILRELWRLRSQDHQGKRLQLQREQWEREMERQDAENEKRSEQERRDRLVNLFVAKHGQSLHAEVLGGGEYGEKWADWLVRVKHGLPMPDWWRAGNGGPDPEAKSNLIKPNQA